MAWSGGTFSRTNGVNSGSQTWQNDRDAGTKIRADRHDVHDQDMADGINACLHKGGQNTPTADLPMGGQKHTGVGDAAARDQYAAVNQVADDDFNFCAAAAVAGTGDAITLTPAPAFTAYAAGLRVAFFAEAANTGAVTLNVNALGTKALEKRQTALEADDIASGDLIVARYDGTAFQFETTPGRIPYTWLADGTDGQIITWDASGDVTAVGPGTSGQVLTSNGSGAAPSFVDAGLPRSYLAGLGLSNGTDADHDIDISVGECRGSDDDEDITLSSALTKQIDASWAAGDDAGGLSSSLTLSADTWYHVHAIVVGGSADVGFDTSVTAANLVTDHSATAYRRIGSVLTDGSSNIIAFQQTGDTFKLDVPVSDDATTNPGTSARTITLSVPTGVIVQALMIYSHQFVVSVAAQALMSPLSIADTAPTSSLYTIRQNVHSGYSGAQVHGVYIEMETNTSAQIRVRCNQSDGNSRSEIMTLGWKDRRGRGD